MKRILLLCIGMMSLTNNASPLSDAVKEHRISIGLGLAAVGCASFAYYFHKKSTPIIITETIHTHPATHPYLKVKVINDGVAYCYAKEPWKSFKVNKLSYQKYQTLSLLSASAFAGLGILTYLNNK